MISLIVFKLLMNRVLRLEKFMYIQFYNIICIYLNLLSSLTIITVFCWQIWRYLSFLFSIILISFSLITWMPQRIGHDDFGKGLYDFFLNFTQHLNINSVGQIVKFNVYCWCLMSKITFEMEGDSSKYSSVALIYLAHSKWAFIFMTLIKKTCHRSDHLSNLSKCAKLSFFRFKW